MIFFNFYLAAFSFTVKVNGLDRGFANRETVKESQSGANNIFCLISYSFLGISTSNLLGPIKRYKHACILKQNGNVIKFGTLTFQIGS